jgi:hypothetical protein
MAKISTYPSVTTPQLSDMLIGTEVDSNNATKNFTIGDIIGLANLGSYVPYTGATADVDITGHNFTADGVTINNGLTVLAGISQFNGPIQSTSSITAATIEGNALIKASGILSVESELFDQNSSPGTSGQILSSTATGVDWIAYGLQEVLNAGDSATGDITLIGGVTANSITAQTGFSVNSGLSEFYGAVQFYSDVSFDAALIDGVGSPGTAGQLLSSNGLATAWQTYGLQEVLDTNDTATADINLTGTITADVVVADTTLEINGGVKDNSSSLGAPNQVLKRLGTSAVAWADENNATKYGVFHDDTTQVCTVGTPVAMKFNTEVDADGVFIGSDGLGNLSYIQVDEDGIYNVQFSAQVERTSGGSDEKVDIWFRLEGVDLPWSNTQLTLKANSSFVVASWNIIAPIKVGERFQIMWHQTGGSIRLVASGTQTAPVRPATPSTILTVTKVA